ncbi:hypothetical protein TNCV_3379611 [Trichonephila clavipes]|nr:hypothetical protein TNCV_3379611 [Trichonephila clavipes]
MTLWTASLRRRVRLVQVAALLLEPLQYRGTLNDRPASCPLMRLVERRRKVGYPWPSSGLLSQNCDGTEPNLTVNCMVLKATDNE